MNQRIRQGKKALRIYGGAIILLFFQGLWANCSIGNPQIPCEAAIDVIREGDIQRVQSLLDKGLDVNCRNKKEMTPLIVAAKYNHFEIALMLCKNGADVNAMSYINAADEDGSMSPLLWASANGNIKIAELLSRRGAKINQASPIEFLPLEAAAQSGHLSMVEFLVDNGADIDYSGPITEISALKMAVIHDHLSIVKYLIGKGARIDMPNRWGNSLLMSGQSLKMVKFLVENGLDVNGQNNSGQTTLALSAGIPGDPPERLLILEYLIKSGGNINLKDQRGRSPLMEAVWAGNIEASRILLENGAAINDADNDRKTPLRLAIEMKEQDKKLELANLLLNKGAQVNMTDAEGKTALMVACRIGNFDLAGILLDHGAELNAKDKNGWTALMEAAKEGFLKTIELLAARGADINERNLQGKTAFDIAIENKRTKAINCLKKLSKKNSIESYHAMDGIRKWGHAAAVDPPENGNEDKMFYHLLL